MKIHLVYFDGCPNLEPARAALHEALAAERLDVHVEEIDSTATDAPEWARDWGSPTILVDGTDLTGATRSSGASCRLYKNGSPSVAEIRARIAAARSSSVASGRRTLLPMLGIIVAAVAGSACCLLPAALAAVGLSGLGLAGALAPFRMYFLVATGLALGAGFWLVYRTPKDACGCEAPRGRRAARVALWITAAVAVALAAYPLLGDGSANAGSADAPAAATLRLTITGMDCRECTGTIAHGISAVPGVVSATVDFDSGVAAIRHDGRDGLEAAAIAAVVDAGFAAKVAAP
jgi:copper chaperone CopZ